MRLWDGPKSNLTRVTRGGNLDPQRDPGDICAERTDLVGDTESRWCGGGRNSFFLLRILLAGLGITSIGDRLTGEKTNVLLRAHRGPMKSRPSDQSRQFLYIRANRQSICEELTGYKKAGVWEL